MSIDINHNMAKEIAREVIYFSGSDPEYLTIVEAVDEYLSCQDDIEDVSGDEYIVLQDEWSDLVKTYIYAAAFTITFPNLEDEEG